jgi:hypothetical protein
LQHHQATNQVKNLHLFVALAFQMLLHSACSFGWWLLDGTDLF